MAVFTNPDGSQRYTFTHAELVEACREQYNMAPADVDDVVAACVHSGVWDVSLDDNSDPVYTVVPAHRV